MVFRSTIQEGCVVEYVLHFNGMAGSSFTLYLRFTILLTVGQEELMLNIERLLRRCEAMLAVSLEQAQASHPDSASNQILVQKSHSVAVYHW